MGSGMKDIVLTYVPRLEDLPAGVTRSHLVSLFHEKMKPFHDTETDVGRALDYAFVAGKGQGGFLVLATQETRVVGALLMLNTGMGGYIPHHVLLFVFVDPAMRGQGLGRRIIELALTKCEGDVKLHVEHDNPAKRLYERLGFTTKYAEMRYQRA